ncbi:MAG: helicase-exonuclease AddAB subunit AddA [Phycisphaerales bacterium]|nr:helicase-exonuclease AddAB subunit AddA [Phycisphaerales bacterium]
MGEFTPTLQQQRAIHTVGQSLLVSAAAGSGKTEVLARRCVHLVCDAPPPFRCDIDELLVLTFTEAAAAEMRGRIVGELRRRLESAPGDARLRRQVAWADLASISTIHSFCNTIVRRHFTEAGIDPSAAILDGQEAVLLRGDVLSSLFDRLYEAARDPQSNEHDFGRRFVRCVDDYGLGGDRGIADFVLRVAAFLESLPDPQAWMDGAAARWADGGVSVLLQTIHGFATELAEQFAELEAFGASLGSGDPRLTALADCVRAHADSFRQWRENLARTDAEPGDPSRVEALIQGFGEVQSSVQAYSFDKPRGVRRKNKDPDSADLHLNAALDRFDALKKTLFDERLQAHYGLFSPAEILEGMQRVAPYAATLLDLVGAFRRAYHDRKRRVDVLDFADLERLAYELLVDPSVHGGAGTPAVAAALRRRFHHVLVDEFQDISPIQAAIIERLSREPDPAEPDNLFVVGDVKQSIYRFRLAEPALFIERQQRLARGAAQRDAEAHDADAGGEVIPLSQNYRSAPCVLDFVNALFEKLMTPPLSPVVYDEAAVLRHGRDESAGASHAPVELHLLERGAAADTQESDDADDAAPSSSDVDDPSRWSPIEREAYLIGRRICELRGDANLRIEGQPASFRDFAILLRAAKGNAPAIERVIKAMGVPVRADAGGGFLDAREVREVLAALRVLDNPQQDIPLASVLRTGIFADPFSVDDLATLRMHARAVPFHRAVMEYATGGMDAGLRDRVARVFQRIDAWRQAVRRRPLAEVVWELYESTGYLAEASAAPDGATRRANLLRLHEYARKFATFRQQGLHRFLAFIHSLEEESQQPDAASPQGEGEDVVRIMTIHRSKGLEFPVVFVAGLATKLNLDDAKGRLIFGRETGLGLRVVDPAAMIEYPTAAHQLVQDEIERTTREEELRVLYVALTRARERLILTASPPCKDIPARLEEARTGGLSSSAASLRGASDPLDWVLAVLSQQEAGRVAWTSTDEEWKAASAGSEGSLAVVRAWDAGQMAAWRLERYRRDEAGDPLREAAAKVAALPPTEPVDSTDAEANSVLTRLAWIYPAMPLSTVRAVVSASEFKGAFDPLADADESPRPHSTAGEPPRRPRTEPSADPTAARRRGIVTHRLLQHLNFPAAVAHGWAGEFQRLLDAGVVEQTDAELIDGAAIDWFLSTPLAQRIATAGPAFHREFPYIAAEPPEQFDRSAGSIADDDYMLVRGIVDGVIVETDRIEIVDYKTDAVAPSQLAERAAHYRPQVRLYARAMSRLWKRPARACHLVFLAPRSIQSLAPGG